MFFQKNLFFFSKIQKPLFRNFENFDVFQIFEKISEIFENFRKNIFFAKLFLDEKIKIFVRIFFTT